MQAKDLVYKRKNIYEECDKQTLDAIYDYAEGYKNFLDQAKTEREAVVFATEMAKKAGYTEYKLGDELKVGDKKYFNQNCKKIIEDREYTVAKLKELGFSLTNSKANFVFAKSDRIDGTSLYLKLKEKGVLVRHFNDPRIIDYNRITIGNREQMQAFIQAVKEILEETK